MSYQDWLDAIALLEKSNNQEIKEKLLTEPVNENFEEMLEPKVIELIKYKFSKATKNIIRELYMMIDDNDMLDLSLVTLRKNLKFIDELTYIKQISVSNQESLRRNLKAETDHIYDTLIKEINKIDNIGLLSLTIKNNKYKWSDENEL